MKTTFAVLILVVLNVHQCFSKEEETVEKWAARFGSELWELGLTVTKAQDIRMSYKKLNARVLPTDGEGILKNIVSNVNRLLKQKMDSVLCVIEGAERLSENFEEDNETFIYYSSKFSPLPDLLEEIEGVNINYSFYRSMSLEADHHFYQIAVNTFHSSVHVPTDVYDQGDTVKSSLKWSTHLDNIFANNYMSDPTMSWQYFGSSTGFLRHYPALHWNPAADVFDCRTRFWYIEAATCSKDVVILVDSSGSMEGMKNTIARLTVYTLLETFSNNDFINIFSFNKTVKELVPCFPQSMLVQATPENILLFKEALKDTYPEDKADFKEALSSSFKLLNKYREKKKCPGDICNQAIILITDSVPLNTTEIFQKYNWFENRTKIPVRVFPYFIGLELSNINEIKNMACMNRGYFGHIKSLEEVRSQVLKYLSVIARPLVLQAIEHPLSWTHSFVDATGDVDKGNPSKDYRFMTSVSGPAFDFKTNKNSEENSLPDLLGVAGTDVLISDMKSLTLSYKIGANGYAFVITNNGYILFHPDLRPIYKGYLKINHNSVDLTEVELLDDDIEEPRIPSDEILKLRDVMVGGAEGNILGLKIKFHYDDMRRVGVETRNYYFAPLNNTPFTMGLVLPHSYGNFWIKAGDEIMKSKQMGISITNYFKGNWRVHPEWTYCDYHRTSRRRFNTSEDKLIHFLNKIYSPGWDWKERFSMDDYSFVSEDDQSDNCNKRVIDENEYFCDKELMQLLVFDAKSTEVSYKTSKWAARDRREQELIERFGASIRFVATQSGLTRWQYIPDDPENSQSFGESDNRALDEVWYRSAVLHHQLDPEAFVFSVPFDAGNMKNITVTASHAIFPKDGGHEAPGSVVGFHIKHSELYKRFMEITSGNKCPDCTSCSSDAHDCYVIDGNGYVVLSETSNDTGRFFGEVEGAIMEAMVSKNIFRHVRIFDYQAMCSYEVQISSGADCILSPIKSLINSFFCFLGKFIWLIIEFEWFQLTHGVSDEDYYESHFTNAETTAKPSLSAASLNKTHQIVMDTCDKIGFLYLLQHLSKEGYHSAVPVNCSRPFYVKRIPHTNLLLIVVNALHQSCYRRLRADMERIEYNNSFTEANCQKLNLNALPRRRLSGCFNTHPLEEEFYECSNGGRSCQKIWLLIISLVIIHIRHLY